MKAMRKRLLSMSLTMLLGLSFIPATVWAAESEATSPEQVSVATTYDVWVCDTQVTSENCNDILGNGKVSYNPKTHTLKLAAGTILATDKTNTYGAISAESDDLIIKASGKCTINAYRDAISLLNGNLTITNSPNMIINSTLGVYSIYGSVNINKSTLNMHSGIDSIGSYGNNVTITNSIIRATNNVPEDIEEIIGMPLADYSTWNDGIFAEKTVKIVNSKVNVAAADMGYSATETVDVDTATRSYGISAHTLSVKNSTVTAKSRKADYANGINTTNLTESGQSTINAYGGKCSAAEGSECYGVWADGDIKISGKKSVLNLYGGTNGLKSSNPNYLKAAMYAESWTSSDDEESDTSEDAMHIPTFTVKNGATLKADSTVRTDGNLTLDGGIIKITAPIRSALQVGYDGYKGDSELSGNLTVRNKGKLIAVTKSNQSSISAVYAYSSINIKNSLFFASAAKGNAIGCPNKNIHFKKDKVRGSRNTISYAKRNKVTGLVKIAHNEKSGGYTEFTGKHRAKTVYAK